MSIGLIIYLVITAIFLVPIIVWGIAEWIKIVIEMFKNL